MLKYPLNWLIHDRKGLFFSWLSWGLKFPHSLNLFPAHLQLCLFLFHLHFNAIHFICQRESVLFLMFLAPFALEKKPHNINNAWKTSTRRVLTSVLALTRQQLQELKVENNLKNWYYMRENRQRLNKLWFKSVWHQSIKCSSPTSILYRSSAFPFKKVVCDLASCEIKWKQCYIHW